MLTMDGKTSADKSGTNPGNSGSSSKGGLDIVEYSNPDNKSAQDVAGKRCTPT